MKGINENYVKRTTGSLWLSYHIVGSDTESAVSHVNMRMWSIYAGWLACWWVNSIMVAISLPMNIYQVPNLGQPWTALGIRV